MHVFPQLRKLEQKYSAELAVLGVHSAKFPAERATENVRQAILRYEIEHPVANDRDFEVWQQYAVRAWPTLIFIDPEGKVIGKHEGEVALEPFDDFIANLVREYDERRLLDRRPLKYHLEREKELERPLSYPGKVLADADSKRLFVADSNHNRVVVASFAGDVLEVIGDGRKGPADGVYSEARFNDPQGMALDGEYLYVADTKSHAIRLVDLANKHVKTLAGIGEQASMFHDGGRAPGIALNSPWDLALHEGTVYIAMAGFHQLWRLELDTMEVRPHAGSGRERILDGPHQMAALAQPSGIATDGRKLYFTDSETSAVRSADLGRDGVVSTIVGLDLFTFGDLDGVGDEVRLQHPLGIEVQGERLLIADTYNNKIKTISPIDRTAKSLLGTGQAGHVDDPGGQARFHEPGGLSAAAGRIYIADTNNHAIRVADLETREVTTLELRGL